MMLPKKERLTTEAFNRFFSTGKRYHSTSLQIVYTVAPTFHCSVVVGKKVFKQAVKRNKLRRQLYATIYNYSRKNSITGVFVVFVKPSAKEVPVKVLQQEICSLLHKIELGAQAV